MLFQKLKFFYDLTLFYRGDLLRFYDFSYKFLFSYVEKYDDVRSKY